MSFPRYPAYKPSGVEWLGEVPEHWVALRLRFAVTLNPSKQEAKELGDQEVVSFLPMEVIGEDGSLRLEHEKQVAECLSGYTYFRDGDVCLAKITPCFENGKGAILRELKGGIGFGTTELIVARPEKEKITCEFLDCLFRSRTFRRLGESEMYGAGGQKRIPDSFVRDFAAALPSIEEQSQITTFLDHETAKIDALIAEQQRLIELLQEKRQAVISHAVTKGLNPDAPMKDSGVEWLGEVPEHWTLKRLKHLSPNLTVGIVVNPSEYVSDEGLPFVYGGDIREGVIDWENSRRIAPAMSDKQAKTRLRSGDLLMVRVGAPGITAVVPAECEGGNCASVMLIRQGSFSSQWLCFTLNTRIVRFQVEVVQYGAAQEQFNISHAVNFWLPVPPRPEQDRIATFLLSEHEKAQGLILQAQNAVSLLQERRSALISAAVTGQIDVRGLVPEASAA
jgi:type I restriction enzyme S subunit